MAPFPVPVSVLGVEGAWQEVESAMSGQEEEGGPEGAVDAPAPVEDDGFEYARLRLGSCSMFRTASECCRSLKLEREISQIPQFF